jgi:hypothetical protein
MSTTSAAYAAYRNQNIMSLHNNVSVSFQEDIRPEAFSVPVDVTKLNIGAFHYRFRMKHPDQPSDSTYIRDVRGVIEDINIDNDYLIIKYLHWQTKQNEVARIRVDTSEEMFSYLIEAHAVFHWHKFDNDDIETIINDWSSFWNKWDCRTDKRITIVESSFFSIDNTLGRASHTVYSFNLANEQHRQKFQNIIIQGTPGCRYYHLENEMPKEWGDNQPIPEMPNAAPGESYSKPIGNGDGYVIPPMPDEISSERKPTKNWWGTQTNER